MQITNKTTFKEFAQYTDLLNVSTETMKGVFAKLENYPLPETIAEKEVPKDLNHLTWEQLSRLQSCKTSDELFFVAFEAILDLKKDDLFDCPAVDVLKFTLFVKNEIERIAKLFEQIKYKPTGEEVQAGIKELNFGLFGTLDWWAKRMGFNSHNEAGQTKWIFIYKCMLNDNKTALFERRLRDIHINKSKPKKR